MSRNSGAAHQYDIYYDPYEEPGFYQDEISQPVPKKRTAVKKKRNAHRRHMRRTLGITYARGVFYLVVYGIVMVFLCSKSSMLSYDIIQLKSDIATLETENKRLAFEIQEKSSLDRIAEIATNQLGMVKPDMAKAYVAENIQPAQINLPDEPTEEETQTVFQRLYASLKTLGGKAVQSGIDFLASY